MGTVFFSLKKLIPLFELFLEPADNHLHLQAAAPAEICLFIFLIVEKKRELIFVALSLRIVKESNPVYRSHRISEAIDLMS